MPSNRLAVRTHRRQKHRSRRLFQGLEQLEIRNVLSAVWTGGGDSDDGVADPTPTLSYSRTRVWNGESSSSGGFSGAPPFPLSQTFLLNSFPGAQKTIYLDFDGHVTEDTAWNTDFAQATITTPPFDMDGDDTSFSSAELERIQRIWQRTAEDFAPFQVNVTTQFTTEAALVRTTLNDQFWGMRAAIGGTFGIITDLGPAGGVAYLDVFGEVGSANNSPAFVFSDTQGDDEHVVTETISHEIGHTLGLDHDGDDDDAYYGGHGNGATSWGPIMGAGFDVQLTQWSNGQYPNANNQEDDLAIISDPDTNGIPYRVDDHGNSAGTATPIQLTSAGGGVFFGIIERTNDEDWFQVVLPDGQVSINADPAVRGPNLDISMELRNAGGGIVASSNPLSRLDASISQTLAGGVYYVRIEGTGKPDTATDPGYPKYGSLGQYTLTFAVIPGAHIQGVVYLDGQPNGRRDIQDSPGAGFTVFVDDNLSGGLDANESSDVTDGRGFFDLLTVPGTRNVRVVLPPGYYPTDPPSGVRTVDVPSNGVVDGVLLGLSGAKGSIHGRKIVDLSGNGIYEPEQGDYFASGVFIYVDLDNDGRPGIGEPAAQTGSYGLYTIVDVPIGRHAVREDIQPGYGITHPQTNDGAHIIDMPPGGRISGLDFWNSPAFDYGDAPESYRTTFSPNDGNSANDGPKHGYLRGFGLGSIVDADANGNPTDSARGDDNVAFDDEDGVRFLSSASPGSRLQFEVTVMVPAGEQNGYLHGWMDLNGDGRFSDSEKIVPATRLGQGTYPFSIAIPNSTPERATYARFRYTYGAESSMGPGGLSFAGEVEDYRLDVFPSVPQATDDGDRPPLDSATADIVVRQFVPGTTTLTTNNRIDVLANDLRSTFGNVQIVRTPFTGTGKRTALGGTVRIATNGTPNNPFDDVLLYNTAPAPAGSTGGVYFDQFTYQITDGNSTATATVYITIRKSDTAPRPVQDIFTASPTGAKRMNPAANDNPGINGATGEPFARAVLARLLDTTVRAEDGDVIGRVSIDNRGTATNVDDLVVFTPSAGGAGRTGTFRYAATNPGETNRVFERTSTVTVQVRGQQPDSNDDIALSMRVFNVASNGSVGSAASSSLVRGREYWVGVYANDLRNAFDLGGGDNGNGALSVYLDMLYDQRYVAPVLANGDLQVRYGTQYSAGNSGPSGNRSIPGLINELGITSDGDIGTTANIPVLYVKFRAVGVTPGTAGVVMWKSDPADQRSTVDPSFEHDILVNDEGSGHALRDVPVDNVAYLTSGSFRVISSSTSSAQAEPTTTSSASPSTTSTSDSQLTSTSSSTTTANEQELISQGLLGSIVATKPKTTTSIDDAIASMFGDDLLESNQQS